MFIRNIIFDLGEVIIPLHFERMVQAFEALGLPRFDLFYRQYKADVFDRFELGELSPAQFRQILRNHFQVSEKISDLELDRAWNAWLGEIPKERLAAIRKLKAQGRYRLFLFSNTNLIHLQAIYKQHGEKVFQDCFEEEFYSFILRQKKPEPRAFLSILARHGLKAAETIHVDDALEHIQGAEAAGLQALQVVPKSEKPFGSAVVNSVLAAINWIETRNRSFHAVDNKASSSVGAFALAEEAPEKKSWFSCCSCLFKSKKKEKQPLVEEQYQYFPSDDYSVSL